ncbi:MAG: branched-chain amino acid ABC transporter permease [Deltaproteobacteria bacterium]|nr:branched-chain amino acid ABC transporter permease [Deltaproteobacteria bacterium]
MLGAVFNWDYSIHLVIIILIYGLLAQSFNLTFGMGRLFNLAHIAAYALGAYVTALGSMDLQLNFFSCMAGAALVAALFSLLVAGISTRLTNDYFAIGTLAFSSLVSAVLINWKGVTRGVLGIPGIPRPVIAGKEITDNWEFLLLLATVFIVLQTFLFILYHGSFSRSLRAQAENNSSALALGIDTGLVRSLSFVLSSSCAGVAGAFFAYYINYIDPSSFSFNESVLILSIVVIGRPGSFWGVLIATVLLVLLPEAIREVDYINSRPHILGPARQMLQALILFGVVWINRSRLFPVQREV